MFGFSYVPGSGDAREPLYADEWENDYGSGTSGPQVGAGDPDAVAVNDAFAYLQGAMSWWVKVPDQIERLRTLSEVTAAGYADVGANDKFYEVMNADIPHLDVIRSMWDDGQAQIDQINASQQENGFPMLGIVIAPIVWVAVIAAATIVASVHEFMRGAEVRQMGKANDAILQITNNGSLDPASKQAAIAAIKGNVKEVADNSITSTVQSVVKSLVVLTGLMLAVAVLPAVMSFKK